MKISYLKIYFLLFPCFLLGHSMFATDYYVNSVSGNDSNNGTSQALAWQSLTKVNNTTFAPGDRILFNRGQTFTGTLNPKGSGTTSSPITIAAYGTGTRPIISFNASLYFGVWLNNQDNWVISDLEVIGAGKGISGNNFAGIYVQTEGDNQTHSGITVSNCIVHDVGGVVTPALGKTTGLISIEAKGENSFINNILIDNCQAYSTKLWSGVVVSAVDWDHVNRKKNTNVTVRNCTVHDVYGDGILIMTVENGVCENSVAYDIGLNPDSSSGTPNGIWFFNSTSTIVQYCEAYNTHSPAADGGAFDIDFNNIDCTVQYSYGHDCDAYGVAVFGAVAVTNPIVTKGSVVRYNVFSNNGREAGAWGSGQGDFYVFTWSNGEIDGFKIYNNTSYWNPAGNDPAVNIGNCAYTGTDPRIFKNNIIVTTNTKAVYTYATNVDFNNNLYWNTANQNPTFTRGNTNQTYTGLSAWKTGSGLDSNSKQANPMLNNVAYSDNGFPTNQFTPTAGSPVIDAGVFVGSMGTRDFLNNPIPQGSAYDIGAVESAGGPSSSVNLLANPSFETGSPSSNISGWLSWSNTNADYTESVGGSVSGGYHLTHYIGQNATFSIYTYQTLTGLTNGTYTFKAYVRKNGSGFTAARAEAKDFGGSALTVAVPTSATYQLVQINNIAVTNGQCTVGFWTDVLNGTNYPFVYMDDAEFFKN
jgi:hypothetical protein